MREGRRKERVRGRVGGRRDRGSGREKREGGRRERGEEGREREGYEG